MREIKHVGFARKLHATLETFFIVSVILILIATAAAKLISSHGGSKILEVEDTLLPLTYRQLLWVAVVIESVLIGVLTLAANSTFKLGAVAWMGALFLVYRLGIYFLGDSFNCPCLGTVTEHLGISPNTARQVMAVVLGYLILGSVLLLSWRSVLKTKFFDSV